MDNSKQDNDLITMGMNLGIYTFAKFFTEGGVAPNARGWEIIRDHTAKMIEEQTGMPAEDLALHVQPVIEDMLSRLPVDDES
jgi:hypothetical protein